VLSTFHPCISSSLKQYEIECDVPVQICDIHMEIKNDMVVSFLDSTLLIMYYKKFIITSIDVTEYFSGN
jgi:hypothetical protein